MTSLRTREIMGWSDEGHSKDWMKSAICKNEPIEIFFGTDHRLAIQMCKRCPVARDCLDYTLRYESKVRWRSGTSGGLTPEQRGDLYNWDDVDSRHPTKHPINKRRKVDRIEYV